MHADCKLQVKLRKEAKDAKYVEYITGVQQGDIFAPFLFLFLKLAVSSTLKDLAFQSPRMWAIPL
jgi:hypothetical protein